MAGLSVNKHRPSTRAVFGVPLSTKRSKKLHTYFLGEIGNRSFHAEFGGGMRGTTNVLGMTVLNIASIATTVQSSRDPQKVWQGCSLILTEQRFRAAANGQKCSLYHPVNGTVEEVTRRLGRLTVWNDQTVPKLSQPNFFCVLPFYIATYGNTHNIKFVHNGLSSPWSPLSSLSLFPQCPYPLLSRTQQKWSKCALVFVQRIRISSSTWEILSALSLIREYSISSSGSLYSSGRIFMTMIPVLSFWWCFLSASFHEVMDSLLISAAISSGH